MFRAFPRRLLRQLPPVRQQTRSFRILGIETSCDDTCVSLLDIPSPSSPPRILHNIVRRSLDISEPWGGIVPNLVGQFHAQTLARVLREVRDQGGFEGLGLIAVTRGPGIPMCLAGGLNTGSLPDPSSLFSSPDHLTCQRRKTYYSERIIRGLKCPHNRSPSHGINSLPPQA